MGDCYCDRASMIGMLNSLPSAQPERWDTCFSCPLSHGCPFIKGCTNNQAEQYAGEIPTDCPLDKEYARPERPKGYMKIEVNIIGDEDVVCETCGAYCFSTSYKFCPKCGVEFIGVRGEQDE